MGRCRLILGWGVVCVFLAVLGVGYVEELLDVMSVINLLHLIFKCAKVSYYKAMYMCMHVLYCTCMVYIAPFTIHVQQGHNNNDVHCVNHMKCIFTCVCVVRKFNGNIKLPHPLQTDVQRTQTSLFPHISF